MLGFVHLMAWLQIFLNVALLLPCWFLPCHMLCSALLQTWCKLCMVNCKVMLMVWNGCHRVFHVLQGCWMNAGCVALGLLQGFVVHCLASCWLDDALHDWWSVARILGIMMWHDVCCRLYRCRHGKVMVCFDAEPGLQDMACCSKQGKAECW